MPKKSDVEKLYEKLINEKLIMIQRTRSDLHVYQALLAEYETQLKDLESKRDECLQHKHTKHNNKYGATHTMVHQGEPDIENK